MPSALLAIGAASVERWSEPVPRCLRHIATNGSAVSETEAMGGIERNCARGSPPSAGISQGTSFHQNTRGSRLDGQYGNGAVLSDLVGFAFVTRGKDYSLLDHPSVAARLHLPPDQVQQRTAKPDGASSLRLPPDPGGTRGWDSPEIGGSEKRNVVE
jgi:hypothetical protein